MVARSKSSNQRPDTLMQDRKPTARRKPLATRGRTIHSGQTRTSGNENAESVLPSITDLGEMRRRVVFSSICLAKLVKPRLQALTGLGPPPLFAAPPRSPVQFQTAIPAWVQQLSARGPDLERGELSSRQLGKRTACHDAAPLKPCMSAIERGERTRLSSALITRMSMSRGRSAPHPIDDRAAAGWEWVR